MTNAASCNAVLVVENAQVGDLHSSPLGNIGQPRTEIGLRNGRASDRDNEDRFFPVMNPTRRTNPSIGNPVRPLPKTLRRRKSDFWDDYH